MAGDRAIRRRDCAEPGTRYAIYTELFLPTDASSPRQTGIGRYCNDLASGLTARGRSVTVLTNAHEAGPTRDPRLRLDVEDRGWPVRSPFDMARRAYAIRNRVRALRPDLLIVGDPLAHKVVSLARASLSTPYAPVFYGTEVKAYASLTQQPGRRPGRKLQRRLLTRYIECAYERVCISRFTEGELARIGAFRPGLVLYPSVSDLFVETPLDSHLAPPYHGPERTADSGRRVNIVTIGRISERKNQLGVLKTLVRLSGQEGLNYHYYILGNVDAATHEPYFQQIEEFIAATDSSSRVTFVSGTSDEEKVAYIDASDIVIALSQTVGHSTEGFGISAIEGSCRARPVIVGSEGGMPETVLPGVTGFSVRPSDREGLERAIMELARNEDRRKAMGRAGREHVLRMFTPTTMAARFIQHFEGRCSGA